MEQLNLSVCLQKKGNKLKICLPLSMSEIQLLRAFSTPAATAGFRNPGYHPTYSYALARPISKNLLMQAWLILGCRPGLS